MTEATTLTAVYEDAPVAKKGLSGGAIAGIVIGSVLLAGIGGFANITAKTPTVVFCMTFDAKGLEVTQKKGVVTIQKEGEIAKFVEKVNSVSFSAKRAIENGQKVLYVTERCVFRLTPKGLKLIEVYPGVDMQKDILDRLPFEVEI